jgi:hypothetical protein
VVTTTGRASFWIVGQRGDNEVPVKNRRGQPGGRASELDVGQPRQNRGSRRGRAPSGYVTLSIPAISVDSQTAEIENTEAWVRTNNLTLNRSKTKEIIFIDKRRRRQVAPPPPVADIIRVTFLKILGVSITNGLSTSGHFMTSSHQMRRYIFAEGLACSRYEQHGAAIFRSTVVAN